MDQEWVTVSQACLNYGVSRRTLTRWIKQGKVKSKVDGNRRLVLISDVRHGETDQGHYDSVMSQDMTQEMSQQTLIKQLRSEIEFLRKQIEVKDKEIAEKGKLLDQEQQLSLIYRQEQTMLESSEQKKHRSWLSRLWKRTPDEAN